MTEGVGADVFCQSDGIGQFFDDVKYHDAGDVFPSFADKHVIFESGFDGCSIAVYEVVLKLFDGTR